MISSLLLLGSKQSNTSEDVVIRCPGLLRATLLNCIAHVFAQAIAHRLRVGAEIAIQRRYARGLLIDDVSNARIILIRGDSDKAEREAKEHKKARQSRTHHFVRTNLPMARRWERRRETPFRRVALMYWIYDYPLGHRAP
jgi:hypothetical protein